MLPLTSSKMATWIFGATWFVERALAQLGFGSVNDEMIIAVKIKKLIAAGFRSRFIIDSFQRDAALVKIAHAFDS